MVARVVVVAQAASLGQGIKALPSLVKAFGEPLIVVTPTCHLPPTPSAFSIQTATCDEEKGQAETHHQHQ